MKRYALPHPVLVAGFFAGLVVAGPIAAGSLLANPVLADLAAPPIGAGEAPGQETASQATRPASAEETASPDPGALDAAALLPGGRQPLPGVITGGQPTRDQLRALAEAGYTTLVDLRGEDESGRIPRREIEALGFTYVHIPVTGAQDLTTANAHALAAVLAATPEQPAVIHCGSGNRVGALLAVEQAEVEGVSAEEALQLGLDAGLGALEPAVRERLGLPPAGG